MFGVSHQLKEDRLTSSDVATGPSQPLQHTDREGEGEGGGEGERMREGRGRG